MCDKNLGPAIIERSEYIKLVLTEHLHKKSTYTNLNEGDAILQLNKIKADTGTLFVKHARDLTEADITYFRHFLLKIPTKMRLPQFYGMPKIHKNKQPLPFRPVISQCGSFIAFISKWLDCHLQPLVRHLPSYTKDSFDLLQTLDKLPQLPQEARIVTTDATAMYTNIATDDGISVIKKYLNCYANELDLEDSIPIDMVCTLIEIVMTNNIFKFGNTWWLQKNGTAMGTACACIYATLYFGYFERKLLLPKYKDNLILYKRMIDNIVIIWVPTSTQNNEWDSFIHNLNSCSSLSWETKKPSFRTHFLDLNIWINKKTRKIGYSTFQKEMNLFLYIPRHSAHPINTTKSLIYSLLKTYKRQNPHPQDFINISRLFFKRLRARGYAHKDLVTHFKYALSRLHHFPYNNLSPLNTPSQSLLPLKNNKQKQDPDNTLFFHLQYHPKGVSRRQIQHAYHTTCENRSTNTPTPDEEGFNNMLNTATSQRMMIDNLTVAYSRPKNLQDILCPSTLKEYDNITVSSISTTLHK